MSEKKEKMDNLIKDIYSKLEKDIQKDIAPLKSSLEQINIIFTLISNKLEEIEQNKEQNYTLEFSKNFEEIKRNQIKQITNSIQEKEPDYTHTIKLLNSQVIMYNYLNLIFLEKYLYLKDQEIYKVMKNLTNNIFLNYNKLENISVKVIDNYEIMNEEINNLNLEINKKDKYLKQLNDKIIILQEKIRKDKRENQLISIKLSNNKTNNNILEQFNDNNNQKKRNMYSIIMPKTKSLNNFDCVRNKNTDKLYLTNKILKEKNIFYKNTRDKIINKSNIAKIFITGNRIFNLKTIKDLIYNIYNSKNIFNNKCLENRQPKETMEEYLYTFFNYKYGLKNMVIEWATNIINGIKSYSYIDNEICLFGKILRNDLDESCQFIMPKIKKNVEENIIKILQKEYILKSYDEVIAYKNKLIKNRLPLNIIQMLLDNIYTQKEQERILPKIAQKVNEYKIKIANNEIIVNNNVLYGLNCVNNKDNSIHNKLSRTELNKKLIEKENESISITFNELTNIIHEFEVNKKENYISLFVKRFKNFDDDNDGILNEKQFINFVKGLNAIDEKNFDNSLNELLNIIDPYGYKKIIFSDCVEIFSAYNIDNKNIFDIINNRKKEGIDNGKN